MNTYSEEEVIELLKQQRHLCQIERDKRSHHDDRGWFVHCEDIMNADAPELKVDADNAPVSGRSEQLTVNSLPQMVLGKCGW